MKIDLRTIPDAEVSGIDLMGFEEIFLCLARETDDDIGCQGDIRYFRADAVNKVKILLFRVAAVHQL